MIGKITTGKSFRGCLQYCLNDKIADEKKNEPVIRNRAEVILYNQCFGNSKELVQQFNEVRQLNPRQSKPVLHITLSLAKGEYLPTYKMAEIAQHCAHDLGFSSNQYVAVLHNDTEHPHIHIVANRVGYDGKTVSDSQNYQKIAKLCRKMETKYGLKQVLNPNAFLPKEQRIYTRLDARKRQLKEDIRLSLLGSHNYKQFEQKMRALKYEVIKMRGIAFRDQQKVYTKGSELGYSLTAIEKFLTQNQGLKIRSETGLIQPTFRHENRREMPLPPVLERRIQKGGEPVLDALLKPDIEFTDGNKISQTEEQRKRRKRKRRQHL